MRDIPRAPLMLGLAGLLPFVWGAATVLFPALAASGQELLGPRFAGPYVLVAYGTVILCFMSGVLWGFAAKAEATGWRGYALSVVPALWAFFMVGGGADAALSALILGFLVLLVFDMQFGQWGLAPVWWMRLRLILTAGVVACLLVGRYV
nr:DUF3429 domain-containing protein [Roseicitreum antarcticum]